MNQKKVKRLILMRNCMLQSLTSLNAVLPALAPTAFSKSTAGGSSSRVNKHKLKPFMKFCPEPRCLMCDGHDEDDKVVLAAAAAAAAAAAEAGP